MRTFHFDYYKIVLFSCFTLLLLSLTGCGPVKTYHLSDTKSVDLDHVENTIQDGDNSYNYEISEDKIVLYYPSGHIFSYDPSYSEDIQLDFGDYSEYLQQKDNMILPEDLFQLIQKAEPRRTKFLLELSVLFLAYGIIFYLFPEKMDRIIGTGQEQLRNWNRIPGESEIRMTKIICLISILIGIALFFLYIIS